MHWWLYAFAFNAWELKVHKQQKRHFLQRGEPWPVKESCWKLLYMSMHCIVRFFIVDLITIDNRKCSMYSTKFKIHIEIVGMNVIYDFGWHSWIGATYQSWAKCIWPIQDTVSRYISGYLYRISILFWEKYCICILSEISQKYLADTFSENWLKLCQLKPLILQTLLYWLKILDIYFTYQRSKGVLEVT